MLGCHDFRYEWDGVKFQVIINHREIELPLYTPEVSKRTSELACKKEWFEVMKNVVNRIANRHQNVIVDGRNAGLKILADADFIFHIEVPLEIRAGRRHAQLKLHTISFQSVLDEIRDRDRRDTLRQHEPFVVPERAITIHNDYRTPEQCVEEILGIIGM